MNQTTVKESVLVQAIAKEPIDHGCATAVLNALRLFHDDNEIGFTAHTRFGALEIASMAACRPEGPFCLAVMPVRLPYSVMQVYRALGDLAQCGLVIDERVYSGSRVPGSAGYHGYQRFYSLPTVRGAHVN